MNHLDLRTIARLLGGTVSGRDRIYAPGLGHSPKDRSVSIHFSPVYPEGFWVTSHSSDDVFRYRDFLREKLGPRDAVAKIATASRHNFIHLNDDTDRTAVALPIWAEARDPHETPVEVYLTRPRSEGGREVNLLPEAAGSAIRLHSSCPFAGKRTPAMVCLVRDILTNEPRAIHRTALSPDGFKANVGGHDRLSLGPIGGGAIKLTPDEDVTTCLGVGEGIESTLSLRLAPEFGPSPVWCLLSAGGISAFPVLPGIECLWIAVDHDPAGLKAAQTCADRWRCAGREVFLVKPRSESLDLNDTVKGGRHHA
jgi:putative DNA primase/helicase